MNRAVFVLALFLSGAPAAAPEPARHLPGYEPPSWLMESIKAVLDASRLYGVDPVFAFWVAFHESTMRPLAKSWREVKVNGKMVWKNLARGLMQISVHYQDFLVRKYLGWHPSAFDWSNPVHSATLGCAMLADYVPKYGLWGALACYNAGEGRYQELWHGRRLPDETERYQRKVLADFFGPGGTT